MAEFGNGPEASVSLRYPKINVAYAAGRMSVTVGVRGIQASSIAQLEEKITWLLPRYLLRKQNKIGSAVRRRGPSVCFFERNLYTFGLGKQTTTLRCCSVTMEAS
jgi:hypothetical protein